MRSKTYGKILAMVIIFGGIWYFWEAGRPGLGTYTIITSIIWFWLTFWLADKRYQAYRREVA